MNSGQILTVGHSTHPIERLIALLQKHEVTAVADVRSSPFSRYNPQFNKEPLHKALKSAGIRYVFLGRELGARSEDPSCYEGGRVQYGRIARTPLFREGLERLEKGAATYRIALLCAEKDPLECHRTLLVANALVARNVAVAHILASGDIESYEQSMARLVKVVGLSPNDLFHSQAELFESARALQESRVAYVDEDRVASPSGDA